MFGFLWALQPLVLSLVVVWLLPFLEINSYLSKKKKKKKKKSHYLNVCYWVPPLVSTSLFGFSPLKTVSVLERFECMLLGRTTIWVPALVSTSLFGFSPLKMVLSVFLFCWALGSCILWLWGLPFGNKRLFIKKKKKVSIVERFECMLLGPTTRGKMLSRQFPSRPYVWLRLVGCVGYGQI